MSNDVILRGEILQANTKVDSLDNPKVVVTSSPCEDEMEVPTEGKRWILFIVLIVKEMLFYNIDLGSVHLTIRVALIIISYRNESMIEKSRVSFSLPISTGILTTIDNHPCQFTSITVTNLNVLFLQQSFLQQHFLL